MESSISSSSSDEIRRTPTPCAATPDEIAHVALRVDVDAGRRFIENEHFGIGRQPFCEDTFCWLPPESSCAIWEGPDKAGSGRAIAREERANPPCRHGPETVRIERGGQICQREILGERAVGDETFESTVLRDKADLAATAPETLPVCTFSPATEIAPVASGMRPKIAFASVERPLPTRPARPTISPALIKSDVRELARRFESGHGKSRRPAWNGAWLDRGRVNRRRILPVFPVTATSAKRLGDGRSLAEAARRDVRP